MDRDNAHRSVSILNNINKAVNIYANSYSYKDK